MSDEGGGDGPAAVAARFGPNLRRARASLGVSLNELGRRSGVSPSNLSRLERGEIGTTVETALRLADGLGVNLMTLLDDPMDMARDPGNRSAETRRLIDRHSRAIADLDKRLRRLEGAKAVAP